MALQAVTKKAARVAAAQTTTLVRAMSTTEHYSHAQKELGRPLSPHVTIYKMPVVALTSIANRFSAMGMSAAFFAGSGVALVGGDVPQLIYAAQDLIPGFAPLSKMLVAFPLTYHTLSAARTMAYDTMPQYINNADGPVWAQAMIGATAVITLGASMYTIKAPVDEAEAEAQTAQQ